MLKYLIFICSFAALPLFSAPYPRYDYVANKDSTEEGRYGSDAELTKKIQDKLNPGWFSEGYQGISANVKNGIATLKGTIPTQDDKERLEKEVRNMEGVRALDSQLIVQEPGKAKDREVSRYPQDTYSNKSDQQLNLKIRDKISGILWDSYKDLSLNTKDGAVVLEGRVNSLKDQQDLMNKIQKIEGVKSVKSNLRVEER
ncbi:MAG TPA: BON domain-containing protein [Waddliaceae bacterium]